MALFDDAPNIEQLIQHSSQTIAEQMHKIAQDSHSEEDVRHACNKLIDDFLSSAGINVAGRHEYGLKGGRIDSKYGAVIIEYKDPKGAGRITEDSNAAGNKAVIKQIKQRFNDFKTEEHITPDRLFGVGCDGDTILFVRSRSGKFEVDAPQQVNSHTVERLLRALLSLGAHGYSFIPERLTESFGADSNLAQVGIRDIYRVIIETQVPKAQTFFNQWKILFREVCGYDVEGKSDKIKKLAEHYSIPNAKPAELLFSIHTYYAIFIKLLAAEIATSFTPLGISVLKRCLNASTSNKLLSEMRNLEQGGIWAQIGITNFFEGDLFSWYLAAWNEQMVAVIRGIVHELDKYDPTTLSVEPTESRDLLKKVYQHLFPKSVRHDLGEYYTPDWLAEHVLDELGYDGNPNIRLLDPSCGSGTFLVMAINRIKAWFEVHRYECGFGEQELISKILSNLIGFDLNPLAVMAARTNYLLAIRDLLKFASNVELPVYLCDSIMTPADYGDLFIGEHGKVQRLKTSVGDFDIPVEVTNNRTQISKYAEVIEECIRNKYSAADFITRCEDERLPLAELSLHHQLYNQLYELDSTNRNGIWARIIKNAFAPLFIEPVDYVVGNPPWINWESLPQDYRKSTASLWQEYRLFRHKGYRAKLGSSKDDLSILLTYVAHDRYLKEGGKLGFVITQSVFKTEGGGEGFRVLHYQKGMKKYFLPVICVDDLSDFQPFEDATNRTAVMIVGKTEIPFSYPVPYVFWEKITRGAISQDFSLSEVKSRTKRLKIAAEPIDPVNPTSPWLTVPESALPGVKKVIGQSPYTAHAGCTTWLNGVYWLKTLSQLNSGSTLIENLYDVGKIKVEHIEGYAIESDLIYPLLRGQDIQRWSAEPSDFMILTNRTDKLAAISESEMKRKYHRTYAYLKKFEEQLRNRSGYKRFFKPTDPFYSIYNVGPYTLAPWKVVWPEVADTIRAGVHGPLIDHVEKPVLPDHTVIAVACESSQEAHFICALLNSAPAQLLVRGYISLHPSPHVLEHVAVPQYSEKDERHCLLADLSSQCHIAAIAKDFERLKNLEKEIDQIAATLWNISSEELQFIDQALNSFNSANQISPT